MPSVAVAQSRAEETVYRTIYNQEKLHRGGNKTSNVLSVFIPKVMPSAQLRVHAETVDDALIFEKDEICHIDNNGGKPPTEELCTQTITTVEKINNTHAWLRSVIRDWQISATSYELSTNLYGGTGTTTSVLTRLPSITTIWQSDADVMASSITEQRIRAGVYPPNIEGLFGAVENALKNQFAVHNRTDKEDSEKFVAAVWRYRNGVNAIPGTCDDERSGKGDGTNLQFLEARFCDVEDALENIYNQLPQDFDPPLRKKERVVFPVKTLGSMPVAVWARSDDVGLMWTTQIEPVLPSMNCEPEYSYNDRSEICNESGAILGGRYPREIPEISLDEGLCSHPPAKRGYMCRAVQAVNCPGTQNTGNNVLLTECNQPQLHASPSAYTESGPNICLAGGWLNKNPDEELPEDTPNEDDIEPPKCSHCIPDLVCDSCEPGLEKKDANGKIVSCVEEKDKALSTYTIMAQLVHVRQQCDSPGEDTPEESIWMQTYNTVNGCCAAEYQAYMTACNAMAEDGVFDSLFQEEDILLDTVSCATAFANNRCGDVYGSISSNDPGFGLCGVSGLDIAAEQMIDVLREHTTDFATELELPATCTEAVQDLDPRSDHLKHSMAKVCSPDCPAQYINSIGNNACYIGSCLEQSYEENRVIPGRVTWKVQDPSFAYDHNRGEVGAVNSNAILPPVQTRIPPYKPLFYVKELDKAFCQTFGLPALTPPILCAFDQRRRVSQPGDSPAAYALNIAEQGASIYTEQSAIQALGAGIGARLGAALYARYFEQASLSLKEVMTNTNNLLLDIEAASLTEEMCPQNFIAP